MKKQSVEKRGWKFVLTAAVFGLLGGPIAFAQTPAGAVQAQAPKPPVVQPAIDGILAAFKTHPLVGMSDAHGLAQQQDFYAALIRDPRFARDIGNVVVEFGTASHQAIIDRYVAGEEVPYTELRKVWGDAVGWSPTVTYIGFANVFATVRAVNLTLPPERRIRVWLGDPPVDWSTATEPVVRAAIRSRDSYPAQLIVENILSKSRKALVIYGGAHLSSSAPPGPPPKPRSTPNAGAEAAMRKMIADVAKGTPDYATMSPEFGARVRQGFGSAQADLASRGPVAAVVFKAGDDSGRDTFVVTFAKGDPMTLVLERDAQGRVEGFQPEAGVNLRDEVEGRYPGSFFIVSPHRGNSQGGCSENIEDNLKDWPIPALATSVRGSSLEDALRAPGCSVMAPRSVLFDGFLYLGPVATLVRSPALPDLYLDAAYRAEISRRQPLRGAQSLPPTVNMDNYPATSRPWQTVPTR